MSSIIGLGKYFFIIPFVVFGIFHLMGGANMANAVIPNIPGNTILVYLTGLAQLAFAASVLLGKYDKLGAVLVAVMLLLFVVIVHVPGLSAEDNSMAMAGVLKDLGLMGGALMYASGFAKDKSIIG